MDLIWAKREAKYFFARDWTGSIGLIGFDKFAVRRKAESGGRATSRNRHCERSLAIVKRAEHASYMTGLDEAFAFVRQLTEMTELYGC
jgi:hypothetical protein